MHTPAPFLNRPEVIIAHGARLVHVLDGKTLCELEETNLAALRIGVIAFGVGTGTVAEFKDIRLKQLKIIPESVL